LQSTVLKTPPNSENERRFGFRFHPPSFEVWLGGGGGGEGRRGSCKEVVAPYCSLVNVSHPPLLLLVPIIIVRVLLPVAVTFWRKRGAKHIFLLYLSLGFSLLSNEKRPLT